MARRVDQVGVHPALRAAAARRTPAELTTFLGVDALQATFGEGVLDLVAIWAAVRRAVVDPEPGDGPHSALVSELAGHSAQQVRTVAVRVWHLVHNRPTGADLAHALAEEITLAGGIDPPPPLDAAAPSPVWPAGASRR